MPVPARKNLRLGLDYYEAGLGGYGLRPNTVAWARILAEGLPATPERIKRMYVWFAGHDNRIERSARRRKKISPALVAWLLWGGDEGKRWARKTRALIKG